MFRFVHQVSSQVASTAFLLLVLLPVTAHALSFSPFVNYSAGDSPQRLVAADLNGGGEDIAVISAGADNVAVFINNGDGTFASPVQYPTGNLPRDLITGDFNGDGKTDLAVANYGSDSVSVFPGDGLGGFFPALTLVDGTNIFHPIRLVSGDLDRDGHTDIVVVNERSALGSDTFTLFRGIGDGTFTRYGGYYLDFMPSSAAMVDVSGNKVLAFTKKGAPSSLYTMVQDSNGYFPYDGWAAPLSAGTDAVSIAAGDVNNDSIVDLMVSNQGSDNVSVYFGSLSPTPAFSAGPAVTTGNGPDATALDDFNADGKVDIVSANSLDNTFSIIRGNGDGTFQAKADVTTGTAPAALVAGDFNGDDRVDVISANGGGTGISVSFNSSQPAVSFDPASKDFGSIAFDGSLTWQYFTITNSGDAFLAISSIELAGSDTAHFVLETGGSSPCPISPATLAAGASCIVKVTFKPTSAGVKTAELRIVHAAPSSPATAALTGTGVAPTNYQLTITFGGTGAGSVTYDTFFTSPQPCSTSCSFSVSAFTTVILRSYPDDFSYVSLTSDDGSILIDSMGGTSFTMSGAKNFTATFTHVDPVRVVEGAYYAVLQNAYNTASAEAVIQTRNITLTENLLLNRNIPVSILGGYDGNVTGYDLANSITTVAGSVTITDGTVTMAGFSIRP